MGAGFWVLGSGLQFSPAPGTQYPEPAFHSSLIIPHSSFLYLLRENLSERREQFVVLFGRSDADAKIILERGVAAHVADEYVAREQFAEDALRLYHRAHDHEVRVRADGREAVDTLQSFVKTFALRRDAADGRRKLRLVHLDGDLRGGLREGVEVVGQHGLADFAREFRRGEQVADAQSRHRQRLRERAEDRSEERRVGK